MIAALKKLFALVTTKAVALEGDIEEQFVDKVGAVLGSPKKATALAEDLSSADVLSIDGRGRNMPKGETKSGM